MEKIDKIMIDENEIQFFVNKKKKHLKNKDQFVGYTGEKGKPKSVLFKNNNLHIDIIIDPITLLEKMTKLILLM